AYRPGRSTTDADSSGPSGGRTVGIGTVSVSFSRNFPLLSGRARKAPRLGAGVGELHAALRENGVPLVEQLDLNRTESGPEQARFASSIDEDRSARYEEDEGANRERKEDLVTPLAETIAETPRRESGEALDRQRDHDAF